MSFTLMYFSKIEISAYKIKYKKMLIFFSINRGELKMILHIFLEIDNKTITNKMI